MTQSFQSKFIGRFFSLMKSTQRQGTGWTVRSASWRLKTYFFKKIIAYQDRFGLFSYERWCQENEASRADLEKQRSIASSIQNGLLVSILVPVNAALLPYINDTLDSLYSQTYPHWEACIIPWRAENIKPVLPERFLPDSRIRFLQGVSALSDAIRLANGDFVAFLHPGDTLSPESLFNLVEWVAQSPETEILYSDEDRLSADGHKRSTPFLKPDWSPELLLSVGYLDHAYFKRELLVSASQESLTWGDGVFRCVEKSQHIAHIPKILYNARESVPTLDNTWRSDAHQYYQLVEDHLSRSGTVSAKASLQNGQVRVVWPPEEKLVSIIIPNKNRAVYLERCISSLMTVTQYKNYEVIVMDNDSQDPAIKDYYRHLRQLTNVKVVENQAPFNFSAYNNRGACHARGELLLFLNNDTEVIDPYWLDELVRWAEQPEIGVVGAKLLYPDGLIQHSGIVLGLEGHASHVFLGVKENEELGKNHPFGSVDWYRDYSAVTGACIMFKRQVFDAIGGFDEAYDLVFSDIEVCLRVIQAGYRVMYNPFARLIHHEGKTRGQHIPPQDIQLGYEHFKEIVTKGDRYFNPSLSYSVRIPTLRRKDEETPIRRLEHIVEFTWTTG